MNSFVDQIPEPEDPGLSQLPGYCWVLFVILTALRLHLFFVLFVVVVCIT